MTRIRHNVSCPCCGYLTLTERGGFEICAVCWWEDDGQDNHSANEVWGGPNADLSLSQARINYLNYGIFDRSREDLMKGREKETAFRKGRVFVLINDRNGVSEPEKGWNSMAE